jgi:L,D-peptidoglycan transpeptidase YkuD (ErfK/YbiS/YcfS/YnhG family)
VRDPTDRHYNRLLNCAGADRLAHKVSDFIIEIDHMPSRIADNSAVFIHATRQGFANRRCVAPELSALAGCFSPGRTRIVVE